MSHARYHQAANLFITAIILSDIAYRRNRHRHLFLASEKFLPVEGLHYRTRSSMKKRINLLKCSRKAKIRKHRARAAA